MKGTSISTISKIYIIGNITNPLSFATRLSFYRHQRLLESYGYIVINPLEAIKKLKTRSEFNKYNLKKLIECNAVYVMSDVSLKRGGNLELKISIDIGLFIIQSFISNSEIDSVAFRQMNESCLEI